MEQAYLLTLVRVSKPLGASWSDVASLVEASGSAEALVSGRVEPPNLLAEQLITACTASDLEDAQAEVATWSNRAIQAITVLDDDYPSNLRTVFNRPPFLFVRGRWDDARDSRSVAVVGTRGASELGLKRARRLASELARSGVTVLSGLALGIDAMAHRAALSADGATSAVMGGGLDSIYPAENAPLADQIVASGGALISQFLPSQRPFRGSFLMRNKVMSGLSRGTVVVEAGPTSGAKSQARSALEHGRPVFLLQSLVDEHEWARDYAERGRYGSVAMVVSDVEGVLALLETSQRPTPPGGQMSLETDLVLTE